MDESDKHDNFDIRELSLIDVSFEDDCLISSPISNPLHHPFSENQERKSVKFLEPFDASNEETMFNSTEENKDECQFPGSTEPEKTKTSGKYNLRKSLAWDNAFFTSEGVLEPEELCSMMGAVEKSERQVLPGIQEDTKKSTDSLSTLESDNLTSKSLEGDLFEDIRASIQKSNNFSDVVNSNSKKESGISQSQNIQSAKKADLASQDKMKPKVTPKKPSAGSQGSGKLTKQVPVRPQTSQSVSAKRESALPLCKPPKVHNRVSSISTGPTKRASLSASHVNMEINSAKNAPGRVVLVSKVVPSCGGSRNIVPKPTLPTRIPLRSSAAIRKELTTSCSSFESSSSTSSDSVGTLPLIIKRKNNSATKISPSSGSTAKSLSRVAPKSKSQSGSSKLSSYLRSTNNLSSKVSPASSTSEWSSKSSSPASTVNQRHKGTRASSDSLTEVSAKIDISQNFHPQGQSNEHCSSGDDAKVPGLVGECVKGTSTSGTSAPFRAASTKPSGLRLPSPKIGFFDGAKSAVRTPNANVTSHPGVSCASPKIGTGSSISNGGLNKAKPGKFPPRKPMASRGAKPDSQPTTLSVKPKSPLPLQELSNAAASSISKSANSPIISPKVQSRMAAVIGGESCMKVEETRKKHEKSAPDFDLSEKDDGQSGLKGKTSPELNSKTKVTNIISSPKNLDASIYSNSISDAENVNPSQIACEDANLICKTNEMEQDLFDDQVDNLVGKLGAMKINVEAENTFSSLKDCVLTESN